MAHATNSLDLAAPMATESTFSVVFRGYSKREVDQYTRLTEAELAAALAERLELQARVRALADQLREANTELVELRRRPQLDDKLTFRHLGLRVEQILAEAEQQAEELRTSAYNAIEKEKDLVEAELRDAKGLRARIAREIESEMTLQRSDAEREVARLREAANAESEDARTYASRLRAEADTILTKANDESSRILNAAKAKCERMWADCTAGLQVLHKNAENQAAAITSSADTYARQTREAAAHDAAQTRAQSDEYAAQARVVMEEHLASIRNSAGHAVERHAAESAESVDKPVLTNDGTNAAGQDGAGSRRRATVSSRVGATSSTATRHGTTTP